MVIRSAPVDSFEKMMLKLSRQKGTTSTQIFELYLRHLIKPKTFDLLFSCRINDLSNDMLFNCIILIISVIMQIKMLILSIILQFY